jgi:AcrR family transcriptional regulator
MARMQVDRKPSAEEGRSARARIVAVARRHFMAHGVRGLTMDELAAELGMSKKTLYECFASKIELLQAVILDKIQDSEAAFDAVAGAPATDFFNRLQQLLACVHRIAEEIQPPFVRDLQRDSPELFELINTRRRTLIHRHFKKLFDDGRRAGKVRKDVPTALIIEILLGATEAIVNPQKMVELGLTPDAAYSAVLRIVLEGLIVRNGRAKV